MRVLSFLTAITILLSVDVIFAQKVKVDISNKGIGGGRHDAYVTTIYQVKESDVKKEWRALMKQFSPEKIKSGGEIMADNALVSSISSNTLDIYAKTNQSGDDVELVVGFDLGGAFVNGAHSGSGPAKSMVYDFAVRLTTAGIEDEIKAAEKLLLMKEKELEKLVKANDRLHQNIDKYNNEIETATDNIKTAEEDLITNKKDQEEATKVIEGQQKAVQEVADKLKQIK